MSLPEIVVGGTVRPDGTLELDQNPGLPPGRVKVVLRFEPDPSLPPIAPLQNENWWQFMQRTRKELEAAGAKFMSDDEVTAHIGWLREEDRLEC